MRRLSRIEFVSPVPRRSTVPVVALAAALAAPGPQTRLTACPPTGNATLAIAVPSPGAGMRPADQAEAATAPPPATDTTDANAVRMVAHDGPTLMFPLPEDPDRPVLVLDDRLGERMRTMAARSRLWARALETLRRERFPVIVGSITQVEDLLPELARYRLDRAGAVWIFTRGGAGPVAAAVTLNLPKLVIRNRITSGDPEQLRRMLEFHLAHEIYGHLLPVVRSRKLDHPCSADPRTTAPAPEQLRSCVMKREREILVDLGYEPRDAYTWDYWTDRIERLGTRESGDGDSGLRR